MLSSHDYTPSPTRSAIYYFGDGDLLVQARDKDSGIDILYRSHSFHLLKATTYFDKTLQTRAAGPEGTQDGDECALVLNDTESKDIEHLMWFFYDSAYAWSGMVDTSLTKKWNSVLLLAEKYSMKEVARVACHALGRANALGDIHKIALCMKHDMGKDWVLEALKRLLSRKDPVSLDEGQKLGLRMTAALTEARAKMRGKRASRPVRISCSPEASICGTCNRPNARCSRGNHFCPGIGGFGLHPHNTPCPRRPNAVVPQIDLCSQDVAAILDSRDVSLSEHDPVEDPLSRSHSVPFGQDYKSLRPRDDLFFRVEDSVCHIHSYILKRTPSAFADMLALPSDHLYTEGRSADKPIALDVKKRDFDNLLWFFYESPYKWSYVADPRLTTKWESILAVADMFSMEEVCRVATYALAHHGGLSDIRRISLCSQYSIESEWAMDALKSLCLRTDSVTLAEAREIGLEMTTLVGAAREQLIREQLQSQHSPNVVSSETAGKIVRDTILLPRRQ